MSKYGNFSGPYFPVLGLNMEGSYIRKSPYLVRIQENTNQNKLYLGKLFGHFSRSDMSFEDYFLIRRNVSKIWTKRPYLVCSITGFNCNRNSRPHVFCKKGAPRNFTKLTRKHLGRSLFFNKVAQVCNSGVFL